MGGKLQQGKSLSSYRLIGHHRGMDGTVTRVKCGTFGKRLPSRSFYLVQEYPSIEGFNGMFPEDDHDLDLPHDLQPNEGFLLCVGFASVRRCHRGLKEVR